MYNIKNLLNLEKKKLFSKIYIKNNFLNFIKNNFKKKYILKIYISGKGCLNYKYIFKKVKFINNKDILIIKKKVIFIINFITFNYIINSKIFFKKNFWNSKILIKNKNIKKICNCGLSFNY